MWLASSSSSFPHGVEDMPENSQDQNNLVNFRDSHVTHLNKTFLNRDSKIRMIVCVKVYRLSGNSLFHIVSEMFQEVLVTMSVASRRFSTTTWDPGITPGPAGATWEEKPCGGPR